MSDQDRDAVVAFDRFLDVLRLEVRNNPELARRLIEALGANVTFDVELLPDLFDPIRSAAGEESEFRALSEQLSAAQVKAVMKRYNLATPVDMKGKSKPDLIDMMYLRAKQKLSERRSS